jgi:hypothetical protein
MNVKKFWIAFGAIFIVLEITGYLIHGVLLGATYESEGIKEVFRTMEVDNDFNRFNLGIFLHFLFC